MEKQTYFKVTNPEGKSRIILAIDKWAAIEVAAKFDNYFHENHEYTAIKSKV